VCKALEDAFTLCQRTVTDVKTKITHLSRELNHVEDGPFTDLKEDLKGLMEGATKYSETLFERRVVAKEVQLSVRGKESERRLAREKIEQDELSATLTEKLKPHAAIANEIITIVEQVQEENLPFDAKAAEVEEMVSEISETVEAAFSKAEDVRNWINDNLPPSPAKGSLQEMVREMTKVRSLVQRAATLCRQWMQRMEKIEPRLIEKAQVELALGLTRLLKGKTDVETLWKKVTKKEVATPEEFEAFVKKQSLNIPRVRTILEKCGATDALTFDHFNGLFKAYYRCVTETLITDILEIKTCKKVAELKVEEVVEVLEDHIEDPSTNLVRFKCRTTKDKDNSEGFVTIVGNKLTRYLTLRRDGYKCVKENSLTDNFDMENFKVLRKLKENDYLRSLTFPVLEPKSGLYRMKAQMMDENLVGWITITGNQGTRFLVNCELPDHIPPKVDEEKAKENTDVKMKDAEETKDEEKD